MFSPREGSLSPQTLEEHIADAQVPRYDDEAAVSEIRKSSRLPRLSQVFQDAQFPSRYSNRQMNPHIDDITRELANAEEARMAEIRETSPSNSSTTQIEPRVEESIRAQSKAAATAAEMSEPSRTNSAATQIEPRVKEFIKARANKEKDSQVLVDDIATILTKASTPDNRLVIYSGYPDGHDMKEGPSITRHPKTDVDFTVNLSAPFQLQCQIIYDPGSDACLFVNASKAGVQISRCSSPYMSYVVGNNQGRLIQPATKRQRLENNMAAEIMGSQSTNSLTVESGPTDVDAASSREIVNKAAVLLLDLTDRETAFIKAPHDVDSGTYQLQRIKQLGSTGSTSVFSCQHSEIPRRRVVAKVLRYAGSSPFALSSFARLWETEKSMLVKIEHASIRNIVALEAFDGHMFAIYLELLPPSLYRGHYSSFKQQEAHTILLNMSSALAYLATQEIVHNDIKPANIAYNPQRGAVLFDFGMASCVDKRPGGGTPWYLPPELIRERTRGLPGDIWATGVTMLYVLGKIKIPEKIQKGWDIRRLHLANQNDDGASRQMADWLRFVARKRAELDQKDRLENAVFQMLEMKKELRACAEGIEASLQVSLEAP
ncbi:putative serine/threonine protein kinase [Trichoderma barbatum]